jgi:paraquat-inducible protein B
MMSRYRTPAVAVTTAITLGLWSTGSAVADPGALSIEATKHMVKECRQQHENVANTVDELLVEMETAQRSLDAARTRAALELSQMRLADLKQEMALCANLMNMIDRRTSEHEASQRDPEASRPQEGERTHEAAQPERGDEGSVQR